MLRLKKAEKSRASADEIFWVGGRDVGSCIAVLRRPLAKLVNLPLIFIQTVLVYQCIEIERDLQYTHLVWGDSASMTLSRGPCPSLRVTS